jgi:hypothetical protein
MVFSRPQVAASALALSAESADATASPKVMREQTSRPKQRTSGRILLLGKGVVLYFRNGRLEDILDGFGYRLPF